MRTTIASFLMFVAVGELSAQAPSKEAQVKAVLDDWHRAAAAADEARYFNHFTADAVFMGTDATERWTRDEFRAWAKPHFAKGKAWDFRAARRGVAFSRDGSVAWFDEDLRPTSAPAAAPACWSWKATRGRSPSTTCRCRYRTTRSRR
jgi:uncharacterized protein (TIGR02246 family)